jgi:RNA polymerase sigma factor for flagellar operon FliA
VIESGDREERIRQMFPLVKQIARRVKRMVPGFELEDLIGDGSVGLIRAVDSYDPQRGPTVGQYARRLIAGAMLNGIRRMDPVSERARRAVREGENERYAIAMMRGGLPSSCEMEARRPGYLRAITAAYTGQPLSLDAPLPLGESLSGDWGEDPARICERRTDRSYVNALVDGLPARQRDVVMQHYVEGVSLRTIGTRRSISPQRVSQLHLAALSKLQAGVGVATSRS